MASKKKSSFRDKVTNDAHRQATASSSYGYLQLPKGISIFSPEPTSKIKLDFLPYEVTDVRHPDRNTEDGIALPESLWYKRPYKIHRNIGGGNDAVVCLQSIGKKCPICEYRAKMIKDGASKEETDPLRPSLRNMYVVIPLDSKKHDAVPHIFDISQYNFQNLLNEELSENPDNGVFPDLEEGLTLKVRFDSKQIGKGQPFAEVKRIDFIEREEAYDESIMKKVPNLDEVLTILSYEELEAKFLEIDEEDRSTEKSKKKKSDDDDDEPETPRRKKKIEKEEEPEEEEKDEEEEKPAKKHKKEREEEEEEEKPRKRNTYKEEEEEKPRSRRTEPERKKKASEDEEECPHGFRFGIDTDKKDACDDCKVWAKCLDKKEGK